MPLKHRRISFTVSAESTDCHLDFYDELMRDLRRNLAKKLDVLLTVATQRNAIFDPNKEFRTHIFLVVFLCFADIC